MDDLCNDFERKKKKGKNLDEQEQKVFLYRYLKYSLFQILLQKNPNKMFEKKDGKM